MPHFDTYIWDEVRELPVDLDLPLEWTDEIREQTASAKIDDTGRWTPFRLKTEFTVKLPKGSVTYPMGALVLHDEYEAILIEHHATDGACGQGTSSAP